MQQAPVLVTTNHKHGGLKQQRFLLSPSGAQKSEIKGWARPAPSGASESLVCDPKLHLCLHVPTLPRVSQGSLWVWSHSEPRVTCLGILKFVSPAKIPFPKRAVFTGS